jgi:hypothetical protein
VQFRVFCEQDIQEGCNPQLSNYMGHIGQKPVYDMEWPLEAMDDIMIHTERGVREVTMEEWGRLKGYPSSWGTIVKDRQWIISEPSVHIWSVMGDAILPTLEGSVVSTVVQDIDEEDLSDLSPLMDSNRWEDDLSDDSSEFDYRIGPRMALEEEEVYEEEVELPPNMDSPFEWNVSYPI